MIGQFDFAEKGWVSGSGRTAIWREIPIANKVLEPQYLMSSTNYTETTDKGGKKKSLRGLKVGFMDVSSATNSRSMISSVLWDKPCGNKVPLLTARGGEESALGLVAALNSLAFDFALRLRLGGLTINYFIAEECPLPLKVNFSSALISKVFALTGGEDPSFAIARQAIGAVNIRSALTEHERLRLRVLIDAIVFWQFGLSFEDAKHMLSECDFPVAMYSGLDAKSLNPKGLWRNGKSVDPELRHAVLALVALRDLQAIGIDAFLAQNDGEGWLIPEVLCLADFGLGHDDRAQAPQPVSSRLGPRFLDWQVRNDAARPREECAAYADLIRRILPFCDPGEDASKAGLFAAGEAPTDRFGGLF